MDRRSLLKALALTPVASVAFPAFASDARVGSRLEFGTRERALFAIRVDREDASRTRAVALGPEGSENRPL